MNVKRERLKRGLTQRRFSEIIGYNIRTVERWESGEITELRQSTKNQITDRLASYDEFGEAKYLVYDPEYGDYYELIDEEPGEFIKNLYKGKLPEVVKQKGACIYRLEKVVKTL